MSVEDNSADEGLIIREYESVKMTRSGREPAKDPIVIETTIDLLVNGIRLSSIVTTPEMHKELVVGYLVTEGAVKSRNDIQGIKDINKTLVDMNSNLGGKMDKSLAKQDRMLEKQDELLVEVKDMNRSLNEKLDKALDKDIVELKADVSEIKAALKAKGII